MIGFSLAAFGIAMAIVQGGLIGRIVGVLGEVGTLKFGLVFNAIAFLVLAFVQNGTIAMILMPVTALGAVVTPSLQGIMSRAVADDSQGALQGVLTSAGSLAMIVSPMIMTLVFYAFTAPEAPVFLPGAPFLLSMALMGACAVVLARARVGGAS